MLKKVEKYLVSAEASQQPRTAEAIKELAEEVKDLKMNKANKSTKGGK